MLLGGYLGARLGPFKIHTWQAEVAKQVLAWQPHRHSNGQTLLTVQPGVVFKHLGYLESRYGPVVSSGCSALLGGYLGDIFGPLPFFL